MCELTESYQYCLLAVFKCLLNTVFGCSAECSNEMWEMCDFIILFSHNWLKCCLLAALENASFGKLLLLLWNLCMAPVVHVGICMCILLYIHHEFASLPVCFHIRSLCPQVRVWMLIPRAAALLNLQHMIHNRSPVKLNQSLLWPLLNIQRWTKRLSWSASSQITLPLALYRKYGVYLLPLYKQKMLQWE